MAELPSALASPPVAARPRRLNWGCGDNPADGWINADRNDGPHVDVACDIREGLPIESNSLDYAVSVHALQELAYEEVVPALAELHRVLTPRGVLRLVLPDLRKGIRAYVLRKPDYFQVDGIRSAGGQFITHMLWYGHSRMLFTDDFVEELLEDAGFVAVARCRYGETASEFPEITELDNRPLESLFVEATKPARDQIAAIKGRPAPEESVADDNAEASAIVPEAASPEKGNDPGPGDDDGGSPHPQIEITEVRMAKGVRKELRGFHLGRPKPGVVGSRRLAIAGWIVGRRSAARQVEVVHGDEVVATAAVELPRASVAGRFKNDPNAERSGFEAKVEAAAGSGESQLQVVAVLDDGSRVPIASIFTRVRAQAKG